MTHLGDTKMNAELISEKFKGNGKECIRNYKVAYKMSLVCNLVNRVTH